jgi:hypothetical protein
VLLAADGTRRLTHFGLPRQFRYRRAAYNRIPVTPVHKAKNTVRRLLEAEIRELEGGEI